MEKINRILCGALLSMVAANIAYAESPAKVGDVAIGGVVWSENCARCHNMRSPSELSASGWVPTVFHMRVKAGLTGQEARNVLAFLQEVSSGKAMSDPAVAKELDVPEKDRRSGEAIYKDGCQACHGADGKGAFPGAPDFTKRNGVLSKSHEALMASIMNGYKSPNSTMAMPAKGGNSGLSEEDVHSVLNYIVDSYGKGGSEK
jgi:mono/diheme cytochrome c family protein